MSGESAPLVRPHRAVVATYNIHRCVGLDARRDADRIAAVIRELDTDILGLQEVDARHGDDQAEYLANATGMTAISGPTLIHQSGSYGNAVLTRWPVKGVRRVEIGVPGREPRGLLDTDIEVAGLPLRVLVTHFGLRHSERRLQTEMLVRAVGHHGDVCAILLGDFIARRAQLSVAASRTRARPDLGAPSAHAGRAARASQPARALGFRPSSRARRAGDLGVSPRVKGVARAAVTLAFFAVVVWLVGSELRTLDPHEILRALRRLSGWQLAAAFALTAVGYVIVACYDRLSARYAGVRLPTAVGLSIAFVSYAFNFNVGAMVGALAFRYRLYSRIGVDVKRIAAIAACSIATNWCGCLTVLGALLLADPWALVLRWELSPAAGRALGALALAPVAAYAIATKVRRTPIRIRGNAYRLPELRFALAQIALGSAYWLLVPLVLYALRPPDTAIPYAKIAVAYGLAALGGIIVRVPAGLGVIEAVFLELSHGRIGAAPILAMVFAWRAVFLLAPLVVAAIVLFVLESRGRRREVTPRAGAAVRRAGQRRSRA
jgi:uncharacterized membrane protein YbhN (UPF0104 family)/endonuclease/exonuclease/phosphatase family metal-dependent hydrolase